MFVLYGKNIELIAVVGTHVDDLLCCANPEGEAKIKQLTMFVRLRVLRTPGSARHGNF